MIVGTAGHIDHGKTSLVKALTGIDTDRLIEEKRRGMTIELGFAQMNCKSSNHEIDSDVISFIDVPGHEKLVKTMLAGATGIDFAMLLIAADDGVMPQTLEHLNILSLLKIARGCIIITKADKADADLIQQRIKDARDLIDQFSLKNYSVHSVSIQTGEGVNELRTLLQNVASDNQSAEEGARPQMGFRMGLDRVFTLDGIGTVVAGSIQSGGVSTGDILCLAHHPEKTYRVRSLQVHAKEVSGVASGQRCAISLAGLERSQVERGQVLCLPSIVSSTVRLDAFIETSRLQKKSLRTGTMVHAHIGTQELIASVAVLGKDFIEPGDSGFVQLIFQRPIYVWSGDRLIIRDSGASHTIAGGVVVEVHGPKRYRQTPERLRYLESQCDEDVALRLQRGLEFAPFGILIGQKMIEFGVDPKFGLPALIASQSPSIDRFNIFEKSYLSKNQAWIIDAQALENIKEKVTRMLSTHHQKFPDILGVFEGAVRSSFGLQMTREIWAYLLEAILKDELIRFKNGFLYLSEHGDVIREADQKIAQKVLPLIDEGRFDPPWVRDLAIKFNISEIQMRMALLRLSSMGELYQIVKDLFYHPKHVLALATIIRNIVNSKAGEQVNLGISASEFRDATGLGRKRAIQILEFFDKIGFCRRVGDLHLIRTGNTLFTESHFKKS